MIEDIKNKNSYPLEWPTGWPRTKIELRQRARFGKRITSSIPGGPIYAGKDGLSIAEAVERVLTALSLMGVREDNVVVSTNVRPRLDGFPRSGAAQPADTGAAVYWSSKSGTKAMGIDHYDRVQDNLAAIAASLEGYRTISRHGGAQVLDRALIGLAALPNLKAWWQVLELDGPSATEQQIKTARNRLVRKYNTDTGTEKDNDKMVAVNRAYDQGIQQL